MLLSILKKLKDFKDLNDLNKIKKAASVVLAALKGAVTYSPTFAVPSAWRGLTSLFGMGRGGTPALSPP